MTTKPRTTHPAVENHADEPNRREYRYTSNAENHRRRFLYVKDGESATLTVYFTEEGYSYIDEEWRTTTEHRHTFDLIDGDVVEHDGRTWDAYALGRTLELHRARFDYESDEFPDPAQAVEDARAAGCL